MTTTRKFVGPIALSMSLALILIVSTPAEAHAALRAMTWQEALLGPIGAALYLADVACGCIP